LFSSGLLFAFIFVPVSASFAQEAEDSAEVNDEVVDEQVNETTDADGAAVKDDEKAKSKPNNQETASDEKASSPSESVEQTESVDKATGAIVTETTTTRVIKAWSLNTDLIFPTPEVKRFQYPADLTARNRQVLETLDYKPTGTVLRLKQIKKLMKDYKKAKRKSGEAINATLNIIKLYEEQAMVFEWMRTVGVVDPKYPNLPQTLKNIRRQQAQRYYDLVLNHKSNPKIKEWKFNQIIARMKLGDPSVRDEALKYLAQAQGNEARELSALGVALDAGAGRLPSAFGKPEEVIRTATDQYEIAAFKMILAEQQFIAQKYPEAIALLQEVISICKDIRRGDKERTPSPILQAAAYMLINAGLRAFPNVNNEITQTLVNNDMIDYARSYLEQFAVANYQKNLIVGLKAYSDALALGKADDALKAKIEQRMLDLNIASNDLRMIQIAWSRILSRAIQKKINLESQQLYTVGMVDARFRTKPEPGIVQVMVRLHDLFSRGFSSYARREDYSLKVVDALYKVKSHRDVVIRTDYYAPRFKDKMNKVNAYRYNLRSRAELMGLGEAFDFSKPVQKNPALKTPIDYVKHSDALISLVPRNEAELYQLQSAYVQLFEGPEKVALTRFESAFTKFPRNSKAPQAASAVIDYLFRKKNLAEAVRFIRLFIKLTLIPSKESYRELPRLLEKAIFDLAKAEYDAKSFDKAALKLSNFQREFPSSPRSPLALELAGRAFYESKKIDRSIAAYEDYLKWYPKLDSAKNIRWMTAELHYVTKNYEKAAQHYQAFNQLYPQDAITKQAALKSAESYKAANKIPEALSEYEKYLRTLKATADQVRILKIISENAIKSNIPMVALSALERLSKIVKQPTEVLGVQFNLMLVYQKMGRNAESKKAAETILALKPTDAEGFKIHSKARYASAKNSIEEIRKRQVMLDKDLKGALQKLFKDYDKIKSDLLAPCEIPGVDWCALGYYEASKLAGDLTRMLAVVEPSNYMEENVVAEIKALVSWNKDKLASESKSFALQAEDALVSSGIPEKDAAERIRMHAQQVKIARESSDFDDSEDIAGF